MDIDKKKKKRKQRRRAMIGQQRKWSACDVWREERSNAKRSGDREYSFRKGEQMEKRSMEENVMGEVR